MEQDIGLFDALYTQRAIRYIRPDPVPDELLRKLVEAATKAPSGGNKQPWSFILIRDADMKGKIAKYYKEAWYAAYGGEPATGGSLQQNVMTSATYLAEHMQDVPVLILVCLAHDGSPSTIVRGSSIYPAVQNLLLAARGLGLGSALTTLHMRHEREIKELLGIPDNVETAALLPIGYPAEGVKYGPTGRGPVGEVTHWERWGHTG